MKFIKRKVLIKKAAVPIKDYLFNKKNELRSCQKCVCKIHRKTPVLDSLF